MSDMTIFWICVVAVPLFLYLVCGIARCRKDVGMLRSAWRDRFGTWPEAFIPPRDWD